MNRIKNFPARLLSAPIVLSILFMTGCAAKTAQVWGNAESGLILEYRMTEGQVLQYQTAIEQTEVADVMGQVESLAKQGDAFAPLT